jgi:hypothetical protein
MKSQVKKGLPRCRRGAIKFISCPSGPEHHGEEVPAVLITISSFEAAMKPRPRLGVGAFLRALTGAATPASRSAVASARPRTSAAASVIEQGQKCALTALGQAASQQTNRKQFAHMTRTFAYGAGDLGPHPAREPV